MTLPVNIIGLDRVRNNALSWTRRIIWSLLIVLSLVALCLQLYSVLEHRSSVSTLTDVKRQKSLAFPAISFCSERLFKTYEEIKHYHEAQKKLMYCAKTQLGRFFLGNSTFEICSDIANMHYGLIHHIAGAGMSPCITVNYNGTLRAEGLGDTLVIYLHSGCDLAQNETRGCGLTVLDAPDMISVAHAMSVDFALSPGEEFMIGIQRTTFTFIKNCGNSRNQQQHQCTEHCVRNSSIEELYLQERGEEEYNQQISDILINCSRDCPPEPQCQINRYQLQYNHLGTYKASSVIIGSFIYKAMEYIEVVESTNFSFFSWLSLVGGAFGLCLGIRVLTLCQICEFIFDGLRERFMMNRTSVIVVAEKQERLNGNVSEKDSVKTVKRQEPNKKTVGDQKLMERKKHKSENKIPPV